MYLMSEIENTFICWRAIVFHLWSSVLSHLLPIFLWVVGLFGLWVELQMVLLLLTPFYRWGGWSTETLKQFTQVCGMVNGRVSIETILDFELYLCCSLLSWQLSVDYFSVKAHIRDNKQITNKKQEKQKRGFPFAGWCYCSFPRAFIFITSFLPS